MNLRGRSGNLFTRRDILGIVKPIYAGFVQGRRGKWVRSAYYEPIVTVEVLRTAQKALLKLSEGLDFAFPALDEGVILTRAG